MADRNKALSSARAIGNGCGLGLALLLWGGLALGDETAPDAAFLEYLGSWSETDEDWVVLADEKPPDRQAGDTGGGRIDPGEESHDDQG